MIHLQRRSFMKGLAASALWGTTAMAQESVPLRERARRRGLLYGAAVQIKALKGDPAFASLVARECELLIPEWEMKWASIAPRKDLLNFEKPDWLVDFAAEHGQKVHGHVALWYRSVPQWAKGELAGEQGKDVVADYLRRLMVHYKGRLHSMAVVNEAIDTGSIFRGIYRDSVFYKGMGKEYIQDAFMAAHDADPDARLYYSDFGVDYEDRVSRQRRAAVLELLSDLRKKNVPVHGIAIQGHLRVGRNYDAKTHRAFLRDLAGLDLDILVSEFDISDKELPADPAVRDPAIAAHAKAYLDTLFDERRAIGVATWGLSNRYSWLNITKPYMRDDGLATRGLPFDENLSPTPLWNALAAAFDGAPSR